MNMKMKRIITAAACVMAIAAAAGLSSCTDVDLEQFYLDSLADTSEAEDSSAAEQPAETEESSAAPEETEQQIEQTESSEAETTAPEEEEPLPVSEQLPDTIYELSESELAEGGVAAEQLSGGDDSTAAEDEQSGVSAAFAALLTEYAGKCEKDPLLKPDFCRYYIADIDGSGTPELLAETGSCEADRTVYVHAYDPVSGDTKLAGSFVAWHGELGLCGGRLGCETKTMGSYLLTVVSFSNGTVTTEREGVPTDKSVLDEVLPSYTFTDISGIVGL